MCSCASSSVAGDPVDCDTVSVASEALSKIASSASVSSIPSMPEYDIDSSIPIAELKGKLSELIRSNGLYLIQACQNFDRRTTGRIPKSQLRQVIRMFCFPISAAQFNRICDELHMNTGDKIVYRDFFSQLSGTRMPSVKKNLQKIPEDLPIDEVELIIKEKIQRNLLDVIRSFWLFDINKDGLIQKAELRRIIRNYCFDIKDDTFDDLWRAYDPAAVGVVSYRDFLVKLGVSADRYKRYMPTETAGSSLCWRENKKDEALDKSCEQKCKRAALENRDDPAIQGLPLEEIVVVFVDRLRRRYRLLRNTFHTFDPENKGRIALSDFRGVINFFVLAMSSGLFNKVMKKLDIDMTANGLDYHCFLENFCKPDGEVDSVKGTPNLDPVCAPVVQRIKNRVLNPEARLRAVFTKINTDQEWQITRPELKKAIELGLDFKLSDEEFKELTMILDPGNTNIINCLDFIRLFESDAGTDRPASQVTFNTKKSTEDSDHPEKVVDVDKYRNLSGQRLRSKLKHHLNKHLSNIEKAILVCDADRSGFIAPERLKDILSGFCFPLTDEQFREIICDLRGYGSTINYHEFLMLYKKAPDEDTKRWTSLVDKLVQFRSRCPPEMPASEVEELLRDCVRYRKRAMLGDFKALDVCNVGIACKDDARSILSKFAFRMTDKQFEELWQTLPRNKYDQLLYDKFLEDYAVAPPSTDGSKTPLAKKSPGEPDTDETATKSPKDRAREAAIKATENRKTFKEMFYAKAPKLKPLLESIAPTVIRNFRTIRFHLRRADPRCTDRVDFVTLKSVLARSGIHLGREDEFHLLEYFDERMTGSVNYRDFLRLFVWYA